MKQFYHRIGYPEPEHIYLADTPILAFTIFSRLQEHHLQQSSDEVELECHYNPDLPLFYDIEFRYPFKEDSQGNVVKCADDSPNIDDWYLAKNVDLDTARKLCADFLFDWCQRKFNPIGTWMDKINKYEDAHENPHIQFNNEEILLKIQNQITALNQKIEETQDSVYKELLFIKKCIIRQIYDDLLEVPENIRPWTSNETKWLEEMKIRREKTWTKKN